MKLHSVALENFRSYRKKQTFALPSPGLIYVYGANGFGKSSLFESVFWCLFGKTTRNLKAGVVANWKIKKGCTVTVKGEAFGKAFTVHRSWKPNLLQLNGKEVDQITLEKELGITPIRFTHSYYFPQISESFFDLKPEAKLSLLADVLGLEKWETASDVAGVATQELNISIGQLEGQLSEINMAIKTHADLIEQYGEREAEWNEEQKRKRNALSKRSKDSTGQQEKLQTRIGTLEKAIKKIKQPMVVGLNLPVLMHRKNICKQQRLSLLNTTTGNKCSACNQPISPRHFKKELAKVDLELASIRKEIAEQQAKSDKFAKEQREYDDQVDDLKIKLRAAEKELAGIEATIKAEKRERAEVEKENPYTAQRKQSLAMKVKAKKRNQQVEEELSNLSAEVEHTHFWIKGFKEVRLLIVDSVLSQLEIEVNQAIQELGLIGWEIKFDVEKENKSGTIRRGFTVLVLSPDNEEAVPWESWSGGETQRLRLAGAWGFANLIHDMSGDSPNFEFWDEPSNWLTEEGINQMMEALSERATRHKRTIMLADHRASDFGGFSAKIQITKTEKGSRIQS